jgi:hypothetical protein
MARLTTAPAPSPLVGVKREPDAEDLSFRTPASLPRKRRRLGGRKLVTPTLLPLSPLPTPQSIPSGSSVAVLTPPTAPVKRDPVGVDAEAAGKQGPRDLAPYARPAAAETSALGLNRRRLGGILHERAHRWRDAASVVSTLLRAPQKPIGSFEETRSLFVVSKWLRLLEPTYSLLSQNIGDGLLKFELTNDDFLRKECSIRSFSWRDG